MRMVWLSCEGETDADTEHMGDVHYIPWQVRFQTIELVIIEAHLSPTTCAICVNGTATCDWQI